MTETKSIFMKVFISWMVFFLLLFSFSGCKTKTETSVVNPYADNNVHKLMYNNPGLLVDLDAGFKAVPMPLDFDGDGDYDLLISESGCYAESGIFYFENISGNVDMPVFRRGPKISFERRRVGYDGNCFEVSVVDGIAHVLTPDRVCEHLLIYNDVPQNVFWAENRVPLPELGYDYLHNFKTQWKMVDFDGDGLSDLLAVVYSFRPRNYYGTAGKFLKDFVPFENSENQIIFLKNRGTNQNPAFENPKSILKEDGSQLAKGLSLKPMFADFDNDGDIDFISISNKDGNYDIKSAGGGIEDDLFVYFENTGTAQQHRFNKGEVIKFRGKPVEMVSKATIHQTAIDWNKDGFTDIIAGDEDGKISFIKNTGKIINGVPEFEQPRFLQQEAAFVDFGALTAPRVYDWDGDGLDDIISGNGVGNIGFIKNLGGDAPKWDSPKYLESEGEPIRILPPGAPWGYTTIDVGCWNEDDLPDILVNHHHGNVLWYENLGTRSKPVLAKAKPIEVQWEGDPQKPEWVPGKSTGNELLAQWRTSPYIMDFNNDGLMDLVMLDYQGYLVVYLRYKESGQLFLAHPERNFVFPDGQPILLNQLKNKSTGRLKFDFADWDGDGIEDLIVASKPAVDWMKGMGMKNGKMVLKYMGRILSRTLMGHTDGPVATDFNLDGIPDLFVGTETGTCYYWQRPSFEVTTTMTTTGMQTPAKYPYFKR